MNLKTNEPVESTPYIVYRYLFDTETLFAFVTILCIAMSVMLGLFTMYHLWLAMSNVTTNERYKRAAFLNYYEDKLEFLKDWKANFDDKSFEVNEEIKNTFKVDEKWNKSQLDKEIKKTEENIEQLNKNFYRSYSKWEGLKSVFFPP